MALDLNIVRLRKLNQKERVLVVLVGIIGIIGLFYLFRGGGGIGISRLESRFTAEEARAEVGSRLRVPEIDLTLLEEQTDRFENERNLFAYGQNRRPKNTPPPKTGTNSGLSGTVPGGATKTPEEVAAEEAAEQAEKAAILPDPPEVNFKFVGFIGPPSEKTVFFTDEEAEENYIGGVGEAIAGQFRILEIGYEYVDIGYTDPIFDGQSKRIILAEWSEEEEEDQAD